MFDVGDRDLGLPLPTSVFLRFFLENPKNMTFYVLLACCTRFLEHWVYEPGKGVELGRAIFRAIAKLFFLVAASSQK